MHEAHGTTLRGDEDAEVGAVRDAVGPGVSAA